MIYSYVFLNDKEYKINKYNKNIEYFKNENQFEETK